MIRSLRSFVALALAALVVALAGVAFAATATDVVKKNQSDLFAALRANDDKKVDTLFDQFIDYGAFAQGSLGSEWANRSSAEQAEFSDILKKLVRQAYKCNLKKIVDYNVAYVGEDPSSGGAVMVKTKATKGSDSVEINFKMLDKSGWKVQDIETESVSLVDNNRGQFVKIIKKDGYAALIQKMKDKLAKASCSD